MVKIDNITSFVLDRTGIIRRDLSNTGLIYSTISTEIQSLRKKIPRSVEETKTITTTAETETYELFADYAALLNITDPWTVGGLDIVSRDEYERRTQRSTYSPESELLETLDDPVVTGKPSICTIYRASDGKWNISFFPYSSIEADETVILTYTVAEYTLYKGGDTIATLDSDLELYLKYYVMAQICWQFPQLRDMYPKWKEDYMREWNEYLVKNNIKDKTPISYIPEEDQALAREFG